MTKPNALIMNSDCYCCPIERQDIIDAITAKNAAPNMMDMLEVRPHYFASTAIFLSPSTLQGMQAQITAIEAVINLPAFQKRIQARVPDIQFLSKGGEGVFMGYDFHITEDGPRLIEINSNAGGAFIVDMLEQATQGPSVVFAAKIISMFKAEWSAAGRVGAPKTIAIVDTRPEEQYHYPDMCLARSLLEDGGFDVVITDPSGLKIKGEGLYYGDVNIDIVYNRLTDFNLSEPDNAVIRRAAYEGAALVTPAPHHHALFADKRNLIMLSDDDVLTKLSASNGHRRVLSAIPNALKVTAENAEEMWRKRRRYFFKPQAGFGSRGAFRGAKLTKKVWASIIKGGYIAQDLIAPPVRAVTVEGADITLKFDVRVYTYGGEVLLLAARVYQGQTTNLRTAGGGLAPVISSQIGCQG